MLHEPGILWSDRILTSGKFTITALSMILIDAIALLIFYNIMQFALEFLSMLAVVIATAILVIFLIFNVRIYGHMQKRRMNLIIRSATVSSFNYTNRRYDRIEVSKIFAFFILKDGFDRVLIAGNEEQARTARIMYGESDEELPASEEKYPSETDVHTIKGLVNALRRLGFEEKKKKHYPARQYTLYELYKRD